MVFIIYILCIYMLNLESFELSYGYPMGIQWVSYGEGLCLSSECMVIYADSSPHLLSLKSIDFLATEDEELTVVDNLMSGF